METISVYDLIGKNAISMQSGEKLYNKIHPVLASGGSITISFDGVSLLRITVF